MIYLIHFDTPFRHARHYIGYTVDLEARIDLHRRGQGARLLQVVSLAGISWQVVRTWPEGTRVMERRFKRRKSARLLCPLCNPTGYRHHERSRP
jgi:predicted GIY-YIG superfamily endonuclease